MSQLDERQVRVLRQMGAAEAFFAQTTMGLDAATAEARGHWRPRIGCKQRLDHD
jgi:hypothetical protein